MIKNTSLPSQPYLRYIEDIEESDIHVLQVQGTDDLYSSFKPSQNTGSFFRFNSFFSGPDYQRFTEDIVPVGFLLNLTLRVD